jgi:hypothetical protein
MVVSPYAPREGLPIFTRHSLCEVARTGFLRLMNKTTWNTLAFVRGLRGQADGPVLAVQIARRGLLIGIEHSACA